MVDRKVRKVVHSGACLSCVLLRKVTRMSVHFFLTGHKELDLGRTAF